jgi:hypothetical protein
MALRESKTFWLNRGNSSTPRWLLPLPLPRPQVPRRISELNPHVPAQPCSHFSMTPLKPDL